MNDRNVDISFQNVAHLRWKKPVTSFFVAYLLSLFELPWVLPRVVSSLRYEVNSWTIVEVTLLPRRNVPCPYGLLRDSIKRCLKSKASTWRTTILKKKDTDVKIVYLKWEIDIFWKWQKIWINEPNKSPKIKLQSRVLESVVGQKIKAWLHFLLRQDVFTLFPFFSTFQGRAGTDSLASISQFFWLRQLTHYLKQKNLQLALNHKTFCHHVKWTFAPCLW